MLNNSIKEILPALRAEADRNPNLQIYVRSIRFSDGAEWIDDHPIPLEDFTWCDLPAGGNSDFGSALNLVAYELRESKMPRRMRSPFLVLFSGSLPTDDWKQGMKILMAQHWGNEAQRIAVAIGNNADRDMLQKFIGKNSPEYPVLDAANLQNINKFFSLYEPSVPLRSFRSTPQLLIIIICDCSDTMAEKGKIITVNKAMKDSFN